MTRNGNELEQSELDAMARRLRHRAPAGHRLFRRHEVGLGQCRDLPAENTGAATKTPNLQITALARIDNRDEIIRQTDFRPSELSEDLDSNVILAAYRRWGEHCAEHLLGDFAFVIWDAEKRRVYCARDHLGVMPLYYHLCPSRFAFASEIKAILSLPWVRGDLDELKIADYINSNFDDVKRTHFCEISRLPAAHWITVDEKSSTLRKYWAPDPGQKTLRKNDKDYVDSFREIFEEAVRCRTQNTEGVGSLLSGGLDSSSITCVARDLNRKAGGEPLSTFSSIFMSVPASDESRFIQTVIDDGGCLPFYFEGDKANPLMTPPSVRQIEDEPCGAPNLFLNWGMYGLAQKNGNRVILDGFDGDTTISHGTGYLIELAREWRWWKLAREASGVARSNGLSPIKYTSGYAWYGGILPKLPGRLRHVLQRRARSRVPRDDAKWYQPLREEFVDRIGLLDHREHVGRERKRKFANEKEMHLNLLTWGVMPATLEMLSHAATAFGIEPRFPFWDKRLVEFCLGLPPDQKLRDGWTRSILRRGMDGILPAAIQWRRDKSNLGHNFEHLLATVGQKRLRDDFGKRAEIVEPWIDLPLLRSMHSRFAANKSREDALILWKISTLITWLHSSPHTGSSTTPR